MNVTPEQQFRIAEYIKCKKDPVYFIENYVKIPTPGESALFKLYEPQKALINKLNAEHYVCCLKSRQVGISTTTQAFITHAMTFFKNVICGVVSRKGEEATDFSRKVQTMLKSLPPWFGVKFDKETEQTFILDSGCQLHAAPVNEANPGSLFRGKAMTILVIDEAAHINRVDEAYTGFAPTLFKSQKSAREAGVPYGTIIISTPNKTTGTGRWYFDQWTAAINGDSIYKDFKIHWKDVREFVEDSTWYPTQCSLLGNVKWKIAQELDMAFVASENSFFPGDIIDKLNESKENNPPKATIYFKNHKFYQWDAPDPSKFYLIGVDTAPDYGNDSSAIQVIEYETFQPVADFKGKLRVDEFCEIIKTINKIYPNNLIIPECNSYGNHVCEVLTKSGLYFNLYRQKTKNLKNIKNQQARYRYGLYTGPQTRPLMIDALYTYVSEDPFLFRSERTNLELIGLVNKNGKVQADSGENDDLAMSIAFCAYVKLYDPPLGFSKGPITKESMANIRNTVLWNDEVANSPDLVTQIIASQQEDERTEGMEDDQDIEIVNDFDNIEKQQRNNKLLNDHFKNNLHLHLKNGSGINTLQLLNLDPRKPKNYQSI